MKTVPWTEVQLRGQNDRLRSALQDILHSVWDDEVLKIGYSGSEEAIENFEGALFDAQQLLAPAEDNSQRTGETK